MNGNELRQLVLDQLVAQDNLQVWDGAPAEGQKALGYQAGALTVALDPDGRAHAYAAVYVGPGWYTPDDDRLDGRSGTRVADFQVTAAGGDQHRAMLATEKVFTALEGYRLSSGAVIRNTVLPGTPRLDREPTPSRYFVPVLFDVVIV